MLFKKNFIAIISLLYAQSLLPFRIETEPSGNITIVKAFQDTTFVGNLAYGIAGNTGLIITISVPEEHKKKGVGSALVQAALLGMKEKGCKAVEVEAVWPIVGFFEKQGFCNEMPWLFRRLKIDLTPMKYTFEKQKKFDNTLPVDQANPFS